MAVSGQMDVSVLYSEEIEKSGGKRPLRCDDHGHVTLTDYRTAVARGLVAGAKSFSSFGSRTTAVLETDQMIWPGGVFTLPPAAGVQMSVSSSSAADGVAGTGIRSINIVYLDADLNEREEVVVLNGIGVVTTTATDIRFVQCAHIVTAGSGKKAAGTISITNGGTTYAIIAIGKLRCTSSVRMVPRGKVLFVSSISASSTSNATSLCNINLVTSYFNNIDFSADSIFLPVAGHGLQDATESQEFDTPIKFHEGAAVGLMYTNTTGNTVNASFFGWIEDA